MNPTSAEGDIMGVRTQQDRARERARHMVDLLAHDDYNGLAGSTKSVVTDNATQRELLFPLLVEVTEASAQMIKAQAGDSDAEETAYVLDVDSSDGTEADIDALPPALCALLRGILAWLEEHHDDAYFQLSLAAADPCARGRLDALVHGLLCVFSLLDKQQARDHAPLWLVAP